MIKGISKLKKGMSYLIITFFVTIIIVAFIVPSTMKNSQKNTNVVAVVNGEQLFQADFARFADNMLRQYGMDSSQLDEQMTQYILNQLIQQKMIAQLAYKTGVNMTDDYIKSQIVKYFTDDKGVFQEENMNNYLQSVRLTYDKFFTDIKDSLVKNEYSQLLYSGVGASPDEINNADLVNNSNLRIKAIYLSDEELKDKMKDQLQVTDMEVAKALQENPDEVRDPKTDKTRMKDKLISEKYAKLRTDFIKKIEDMSKANAGIEDVLKVTGGTVVESNDFKIGASVTAVAETTVKLDDLTQSNAFYEVFLKLNENQVSAPIESKAGLFIFAPLKKEIKHSEGFDVTKSDLGQSIQSDKMGSLQNAVITSFIEKSKVERNN
ncbi:MAG: SurA N-terminal domain-containing protein [Spirochaetes bacterium]|nr:SurA N-terminal domain-containing protein [Spirochaetota bacterium]